MFYKAWFVFYYSLLWDFFCNREKNIKQKQINKNKIEQKNNNNQKYIKDTVNMTLTLTR